jgi:PDZ domain-containing protein
VVDDVRIGGAVRDWIDPNYTTVPRSVLIAPDETEEEAEQRVTDQMTESQDRAGAAALSFLGYDVKITNTGARVLSVAADAPASRVLKRGDLIVSADSKPVTNPDDLAKVIGAHRVGDEVVLEVVRGSKRLTVRSGTVAHPDDPADPIIGVVIEAAPRVDLPLAVKIDSLQIGGPSAGLMFALGIVDLLNGSDLTKGRTVAGTGEISVDGTVGPVGGVRQKIGGARSRGATLFLVPLVELDEACAAAGDLSVVGVENLRDAVRVLTEGERSPERACPR